MKIEPGFASHWKTERLIDQLGGDGVVALLRLWGNAQIRRQWRGLTLTPKRLAMETKWKGDANHLFSVFTDPDAPWLDKDEDGTFSIHGFEDHQRQVIHLWNAGPKGGRPKKAAATDPPKYEDKEDSSSSSYPISEANENHMVFETAKPMVSLEAAKAYGPNVRLTEKEVELWWHTRNAAGWTKGSANGGAPRKITSWQSDLATSVSWIKESLSKPQKANGNFNSSQLGI